MSKKSKADVKISIAVPNGELVKHIGNAYGLVSQYRTVNKVPHESMENWLLRLVVEGCNAMFSYHNQQLAAQAEHEADKAEVAEAVEPVAEPEEVVADAE